MKMFSFQKVPPYSVTKATSPGHLESHKVYTFPRQHSFNQMSLMGRVISREKSWLPSLSENHGEELFKQKIEKLENLNTQGQATLSFN